MNPDGTYRNEPIGWIPPLSDELWDRWAASPPDNERIRGWNVLMPESNGTPFDYVNGLVRDVRKKDAEAAA